MLFLVRVFKIFVASIGVNDSATNDEIATAPAITILNSLNKPTCHSFHKNNGEENSYQGYGGCNNGKENLF
jgi:hypothetical protein